MKKVEEFSSPIIEFSRCFGHSSQPKRDNHHWRSPFTCTRHSC